MRRRTHSTLLLSAILLFTAYVSWGQVSSLDSDHDGLSDETEAALLQKFSPTFMVSRVDCSVRPAQFLPDVKAPTVKEDDGTIYGQAFPRKGNVGEVELHFYHLWRRDCGEMGHALDTEHVSALISYGGSLGDAKAIYWYAAAHEDTICDASQVTRAETLHAEDHGAKVWISEGKHGSFLSELLCTHGCGGDRCEQMEPLKIAQIINLGEIKAPMNGISWLGAAQWPLSDKMQRTDFVETRVTRVQRLPESDIAWANPAKRPAQAAILGANAGINGAAVGARSTDAALSVADDHTSSALGTATDKTGGALKTSSRSVWKALKKSVEKTGQFLGGGGN